MPCSRQWCSLTQTERQNSTGVCLSWNRDREGGMEDGCDCEGEHREPGLAWQELLCECSEHRAASRGRTSSSGMIPAKSRLLGGDLSTRQECDDGETSPGVSQGCKSRRTEAWEWGPLQSSLVTATGFKLDKIY